MSEGFRSGFVTLVGRPNTGKSTLVNALVGQKIAAVTPHPQTTRTHLLGIVNAPQGQAVLVDTPGVHRGRGLLDRKMARSVREGLEGRDLSLFLVDAARAWGAEDEMALELARSGQPAPPAFLVINKIDRLARRDAILPIIAALRDKREFAEVVPISALRRENLDELLRLIWQALPEGPAYYPADQPSDQPEQFWITEIIREQAMLATKEEIPHALAVRIEADRMRRSQGQPLRVIEAVLVCERAGQKAMLIGREGTMIQRIGSGARQQLEASLGTRLLLRLEVVVRSEWRQDREAVANLDFRRMV
ncbi:MAG: GTPase Era [Terriglobales bacterium]